MEEHTMEFRGVKVSTKPLSLEEYMRVLLRTGLIRESVLEKCFQYAGLKVSAGDYAGFNESLRVRLLEDAALACGIHGTQIGKSEDWSELFESSEGVSL